MGKSTTTDNRSGRALRRLTDREMQNGLAPEDLIALKSEAAAVKRRIFQTQSEKLLTDVRRISAKYAEHLLNEGLPAFIIVEGVDGIVRQMPDGTRNIVEVIDGEIVSVRTLDPVPPQNERPAPE